MTYVVAGVSGNTGKVVAETEKVRVIVRDLAKGQAFAAQGAEVAVADLTDAPALAKALSGAKGAYLLVPPDVTAENVLAAQARVTESIAKAVAEARVPHVVFLSSIAAHLPSGTGPIATVADAEKRLGTLAGTAFTFLRPSYFMENFAGSLGELGQGVFNSFIAAGRAFPVIATQDIGLAAAERLLRGAKANEVVQLAGPKDVTIEEVAAVFGEVARRPVELRVAPTSIMVDVLAGFGLSRDMGRLYVEMTDSLNAGSLTYDASLPVERTRTPLIEVAKRLVG
jgi:uncharacterized protein YbjT (DUF2867 family)